MSSFHLERTAQLWGISGNLGGGKTMTAVQFAVNAIRDGYFVVSNITLDVDAMVKAFGDYCSRLYMHISLDDAGFDPFKIPCGSPRGSGGGKRVLVILDECAEWVDQYSSAKDPRISRLWSWLRHSSKRSQDVFIVVQRPDYLNKVIRILISRWLWVYDLAVWRVPFLRMRIPFCGNLILRSIYDNKGKRIGPLSFIAKDYWGRFYNTAECLNGDGATYNFEYSQVERPRRSLKLMYALWLLSLYWLYKAVSAGSTLVPTVPRGYSFILIETAENPLNRTMLTPETFINMTRKKLDILNVRNLTAKRVGILPLAISDDGTTNKIDSNPARSPYYASAPRGGTCAPPWRGASPRPTTGVLI